MINGVHGLDVAAGKCEVNFNALIWYTLGLLDIVLGNYSAAENKPDKYLRFVIKYKHSRKQA